MNGPRAPVATYVSQAAEKSDPTVALAIHTHARIASPRRKDRCIS
jgi:hypothetical protein